MKFEHRISIALSLTAVAALANAKGITVGTGKGADFSTIQAAINASQPGDEINVRAGTYLEQLVIGPGKDKIRIQTDKATISPPGSMVSGSLITISGAHNVSISGFTISGPLPDSAFTGSTTAAGIYMGGGASATISNNTITQIWQATASSRGIQNGVAIQVGRRFDGASASAAILNNTITHWQKNAITIDNTGSNAIVTGNTVTGEGPINYTAQNGIQVGRGATALVQNNDVSALSYTPATFASSGILVFETNSVTVSNNRVSDCDLGVAFADVSNSEIDHNHLSGGLYAIDLDEFSSGSQMNEVDHNEQKGAAQEGIFVSPNSINNMIDHDNFKNNGFLDAEDDSVGSGTGGTGNLWSHNHIATDNHGGALAG